MHNNHKHQHKWRTKRARNGCSYTISEDGTIILPVGARPPDFGDHEDDSEHDNDDDPETLARQTSFIRNRLAAATRR